MTTVLGDLFARFPDVARHVVVAIRRNVLVIALKLTEHCCETVTK
jgi:hypothetical protein